MNKEEAKLEFDTPAWYDLIENIVNNFPAGTLITHSWLKKSLYLEEINMKDYESTLEIIEAIELQQFTYMGLVDKLRWDMLEKHKCFLKNVRGDGYTILPPKDQVDYSYKKALRDVRKTLKQSFKIMEHVRFSSNDHELKNKNTANKIKLSMLKQIISK